MVVALPLDKFQVNDLEEIKLRGSKLELINEKSRNCMTGSTTTSCIIEHEPPIGPSMTPGIVDSLFDWNATQASFSGKISKLPLSHVESPAASV